MWKGLMSLKEVSEYLGGWLEATIKDLVEAKKLPGVRIDGKWFFSRSLIDEWIKGFVQKFKWETLEKNTLIKKIEESHVGAISDDKLNAVMED